MKNFQQNLFIVLALGLCALSVWQWYVQTVQRDEIETQNRMLFDRDSQIQSDTNSIATLNAKINDMDAELSGLKGTVATNQHVIASQKARITELSFDNESLTNEVAQYKIAVDTVEAKLKEAYAGIAKQNETITNLLSDRDQLVEKYNELATNRNAIVLKYNALVKQMENQPAPQ